MSTHFMCAVVSTSTTRGKVRFGGSLKPPLRGYTVLAAHLPPLTEKDKHGSRERKQSEAEQNGEAKASRRSCGRPCSRSGRSDG